MRAKLFAIESHSLETSSDGNSMCSVEIDPGCFSTSTFINGLTVAALYERRINFRPPVTGHVGPARKQNASTEFRTSTPARDNLRNRKQRSWRAYLAQANRSCFRDRDYKQR